MREIRHHPLLNQWVVVAPDRERRPMEYELQGATSSDSCPFCPGHEGRTPAALWTWPPTGPWQVRIIPNRYPALRVEECAGSAPAGAYGWMSGVGAHEVVLEWSGHAEPGGRDRARALQAVFEGVAARMTDLQGDGRLKCARWFRNRGALAGATLAHPHSQLLALPRVPPGMLGELQRAEDHLARTGRCLLEDLLHEERRQQTGLLEDAQAVVWCPWASRVPFEFWCAPSGVGRSFEQDSAGRSAVAAALARALDAVDQALDRPALHLSLHACPWSLPQHQSAYPWHIRVQPVLTPRGALEAEGDLWVNPVTPARAAESLRTFAARVAVPPLP
jgi:UDPglucose--hexose-1-phosphate uridylyltransferase